MRTALMLAALASGLALTVACSYAHCPFGTFPFDGATGVPADVVIELTATNLPSDLPSLHDAVGLETLNGDRVEVDVEVIGDQVWMTPIEPLQPDTVYRAWGIDEWELQASHWWGYLSNDSVSVQFSTGGTPRLSEVARIDDRSIVLAFTEPVDLDSLYGNLEFVGNPDYVVVGTYEGSSTLVEVLLSPSPGDLEVRLRPGVRTETGRPVDNAEGGSVVEEYTYDLVERHTHQPYCH